MRLWPPTFTNGIHNSLHGNEIPHAEGANLNKALALLETEGGLLGGGPSADQGAGGGGVSGGGGNGARAPGPAPSGGGGAGPGSSGGVDGGAGTPGGRSTTGTCGKTTDPPAPDPEDPLNRGVSGDRLNLGGNGGTNIHYSGTMPAELNQTCNGTGKGTDAQKGCPPCEIIGGFFL
ncbi:MAG: hypothetical protein KF760_34125 [Candidatus Eremiobacteraeota bacterium]|nr:hypothetical protein [Candidatus Eremiobacteraeota bacterium]MCW5871078.1 hypothetical protein [Candidatus Eremiobacteraeota bacterium]